MKSLLIFLCIWGATNGISVAQENRGADYNSSGFLYLMHLPNNGIIMTSNLIINARNIEKMEIISRFETLKRYGAITKAGGILVLPKPGLRFVILDELLDEFKLSKSGQSLPVFIDDHFVREPETIVAVRTEIKTIEVVTNSSNESIINIITVGGSYSQSSKTKSDFRLNDSEIRAISAFIN